MVVASRKMNNFSVISGQEQVTSNELIMSYVYYTNTVLDHCNNRPRVDMSLHSDTLS